MKLTDLEANLPVVQRLCVYGPPKSGKSQLVSQLAEHFNLEWVDFENGMSPLLKLPVDWKQRVNIAKIPDCKDLPIGIETALKLVSGAKVTVCYKHGKGNCLTCNKDVNQAALMTTFEFNKLGPRSIVVFDSLTQIATSALNWVMRSQPEEAKPERDDWGALKFVMDKFLSNLQQARYNIICITHEDEVEMIDGKDKLVPVSGSRNTSRNTAKYFDHVVYCNVANKKHIFGSATTYAASVMSGSRLDINIEGLAEPSLLPFFQHLLRFPLETPPLLIEKTVTVTTEHEEKVLVENPEVEQAKDLEVKIAGAGAAVLARLKLEALRKKGRI